MAVVQARYARPGPDGLNKTERAYAARLEERKRTGEIFDFRPHAFKLLLVPGVPKSAESEGVQAVWYTPDFVVFANDGTLEFHETKGYLDRAGDGWLKFKMAVSTWPFPFFLVRKVAKVKGCWDVEAYRK